MSNRQYPYQQYPWYGGQYQQPGGYPGSPPSYGPPQHGTTGQQHQPYSPQHGTSGQQHQPYSPQQGTSGQQHQPYSPPQHGTSGQQHQHYGSSQHGTTGQQHQPYGSSQHGTSGQHHQPYGSTQHGTTGQQHQHYGPPGAPPSFVPQHATGHLGAYAVDPGAIRPCIHQFIYIWPEHGHGFWAWLTYVGRRSVAGFRWTGYRWVYFGMDTRQIQSFYCH
ncbi:hypothetical protein [Fictibacillus gelatini]|uniref:hypothetical protein n=1 Tax=Fictibacillus gelatini TaxID=225985 RepID=UPI000417950E|nr:hypothetical protein [Fictibacillus gelatini]